MPPLSEQQALLMGGRATRTFDLRQLRRDAAPAPQPKPPARDRTQGHLVTAHTMVRALAPSTPQCSAATSFHTHTRATTVRRCAEEARVRLSCQGWVGPGCLIPPNWLSALWSWVVRGYVPSHTQPSSASPDTSSPCLPPPTKP